MLTRQPLIGEPRSELAKGFRSFPVGNYVIIYEPIEGIVHVHRVIHGARDIEQMMWRPDSD
jgi:toxin ParE1/3/4